LVIAAECRLAANMGADGPIRAPPEDKSTETVQHDVSRAPARWTPGPDIDPPREHSI
jgi:hypothetical protein